MIQKPQRFAPQHADAFQDCGVVKAYRHRPPYPAETFDILAGLITGEPRRVLDIGCGTGNVARHLVERVDRIDAVDVSREMIERGKRLPNGNHRGLRWLHGRVEDVTLDPPYALVTAGESLHWMDLAVVLPRFGEALLPGGLLAIVSHDTTPDPWSTLGEIIPRYRTDGGYQPYDMIAHLEQCDLFRTVCERRTAPVPWTQSVDDYVESYHSRSNFSRERMGAAQAAAFDREARECLLAAHSDGVISLQITGHVVWGLPV